MCYYPKDKDFNMKKLFDVRITGVAALLLIIVAFVDVLFFTDAGSISEMTGWGRFSVIGVISIMLWMLLTNIIIPAVFEVLKFLKK